MVVVGYSFMFLCSLIIKITADETKEVNHNWFQKGKCKGLWRSERLLGRCFGLKELKDFPELSQIKEVRNAEDCRSLCCNLGSRCVSWQYQASVSECKLGGVMRLGLEVTGTGDWCDPHPPGRWNGRRIVSREDSKCVWGEELPNQCFGLGPERKNSTGGSLNTEECEKACCSQTKAGVHGDGFCDLWQEIPGRGCYFSKKDGIWCDKPQGIYEGGRKCIPDYCGGPDMELKILTAYNASQQRLIQHLR